VGVTGFRACGRVRVGLAYSRKKLALRTKIRNLNLKSQRYKPTESKSEILKATVLNLLGGLLALKWARLVILIKNLYTLWGRKRILYGVGNVSPLWYFS